VVPGDNWDCDAVQQLTLADLLIGGRLRRVIMQASKNGFFYVLDRITGEFISAEPFAVVNWAKGIDVNTGRPLVNDAAYYGADAIALSPGIGGAHNWAPMAFSPITSLVYVPTTTFSSTSHAVAVGYEPLPLRPGMGPGVVRPNRAPVLPSPPAVGPPPAGNALVAWDPVAQQMRWRTGGGTTLGGAVATAGGLVFQVIREGRLLRVLLVFGLTEE
jgi:quinohemoprotein ethanol dehydrogenase